MLKSIEGFDSEAVDYKPAVFSYYTILGGMTKLKLPAFSFTPKAAQALLKAISTFAEIENPLHHPPSDGRTTA